MSKKERNLAIGAIVGAGVGYVTGILSAPRSGRRTRKKLSNSANKAKTDSEKQLKKLYSELSSTVEKAEKQLSKAKTKANVELKDAVARAKVAKDKTKLLLSALHDGDAEDPDLKKMVKEAKKAKDNLLNFYKK